MPNNNNDEILQDELDLEQEEKKHARSRDDDFERERTVDGEEIYQPEQEEPVEEEAYDPTQDEEHDEYYEDMFEEDWEEVEAKEQARKEKEEELAKKKAQAKEKDKRIKARREEQRKKDEALRQEEVRRRDIEAMEAANKKGTPTQEENAIPSVGVAPAHDEQNNVQTQEPVIEQSQTANISEQQASQVEVAIETDKTNKSIGQDKDTVPVQTTQKVETQHVDFAEQHTQTVEKTIEHTSIESEVYQDSLYEEQKREAFNRQMEEQERAKETPTQQYIEENVTQAEGSKVTLEEQKTIPYVNTTPEAEDVQKAPSTPTNREETVVTREQSSPVGAANDVVQNDITKEEAPQAVRVEAQQTVPNSDIGSEAIQNQHNQNNGQNVVIENEKTASDTPVVQVEQETVGSNADFHQQMVESVENAEYSREHQKYQQEQREQFEKEETSSTFETQAKQEQHNVVHAHEEYNKDIPPVSVSHIESNATTKTADIFDIPEAEKPFYNHAGIPTSVVDAAVLAASGEVTRDSFVAETVFTNPDAVVSQVVETAKAPTQTAVKAEAKNEQFAKFDTDFGIKNADVIVESGTFQGKEKELPIEDKKNNFVNSEDKGAYRRPIINEEVESTPIQPKEGAAKAESVIPGAPTVPHKEIVGQRNAEIVGQGETIFKKGTAVPVGTTAPLNKEGKPIEGTHLGVAAEKDSVLSGNIDKSVYDKLAMPDYVKAAQTVSAGYEVEITALNTKLSASREQLRALKDSGASAAEIKAVRDLIKTDNDRLQLILKDKERVDDFLQNGPRTGRHITKDDVLNAEYSRNHKAEVKAGQAGLDDAMGAAGAGVGDGKKMFYSSANLKGVRQGRLRQAFGTAADKTVHGMKGAARRITAEDQDLDDEEKLIEKSNEIRRTLSSHLSVGIVGKELKTLGLDKATMQTSLKEMGVIVGVGEVSKMKLFDMKEALVKGGGKTKDMKELMELLTKNGSTLSAATQKQLLEAIELKTRLGMDNLKLAELALKDAGEFAGWSKKLLKKELKTTTDIIKKKQLEAALKYHKLNKWTNFANQRWVLTKGLVGGAVEKVLDNNEHLADAIGIGRGAVTTYKIGRVVGNNTVSIAKETGEVAVKTAKWTKKQIVGLHNKFDMAQRTKFLHQHGMREANLIGKDATKVGKATKFGVQKGTSKFAQSKFGQAVARGIEAAKTGVAAAGKTIAAGIKGAAGVISAIVGGAGMLVMAFLLIAIMLIGIVYVVVLGDDGTRGSIFDRSTSVVEMVEYLEEKNAAWLEEIEALTEAQPTTRDKHGDPVDEYTKIHYTYYDSTGNTCMTTNNTKEIISMAAVYFENDFSDADKVYEYIDELWEKSHILTYSESTVYNEGTDDVCFTDGGQFDTTAQGFNGHERKYYCTEDYTNISYSDCYAYGPESDYRVYMDQRSFRFSDAIASFTKYYGINMLTTSSSKGYGCQEETGRFYCTNINSISNSEVLVGLVDATGQKYSNLSYNEGCQIKHPYDSEGAPISDCYDYSVYYKYYYVGFGNALPSGYYYDFEWNSSTNRYEWQYEASNGMEYSYAFSGYGSSPSGKYYNISNVTLSYDYYEDGIYWYYYSIPFYSCDEQVCYGHTITYHTCSGHEYEMEHLHNCYGGIYRACPEHLEKVCHGHVDLNINLEVRGFERNWLFMTAVDCDDGYLWDTEDKIEWATELRDQDWKDLYGVEIPSSLFVDDEFMGTAIMPSHANSLPIPLYNQLDYNTPYGAYGTVASHGCGITCIAMVTAYYWEEDVSPAWMGRTFGSYNTSVGSLWSVFAGTAPDLGIPFEKQTSSWSEVVDALQAGKPVISIQNTNDNQTSIFTSGGHFILLTGITNDGRILVNDPNGANYYKSSLSSGFMYGFSQSDIQRGGGTYWIYGAKEAPENS